MASLKEGWTVEGKTATFNGGTLGEIHQYGKKVAEQWSYRATVTLGSGGLTVNVEDDDCRSGMAHGGSYTDITVPLEVLAQLMGN